MTPADLAEYARVMSQLGIFKLTTPDGVVIEMSASALQEAAAERVAAKAARETPTEPPKTEPAPAREDEDDPLLYAATEGMPG